MLTGSKIKKIIWDIMSILVICLCIFAIIELSDMELTVPVIILSLLSVLALSTTTIILILKIAYKRRINKYITKENYSRSVPTMILFFVLVMFSLSPILTYICIVSLQYV